MTRRIHSAARDHHAEPRHGDAADRSGIGSPTPWPDRIDLPDGFRPEGIAIAHGRTAYVGSSLADGDIYAADLRTGEGSVISEGPGTSSVGLKLDHRADCSSPAVPLAARGC